MRMKNMKTLLKSAFVGFAANSCSMVCEMPQYNLFACSLMIEKQVFALRKGHGKGEGVT